MIHKWLMSCVVVGLLIGLASAAEEKKADAKKPAAAKEEVKEKPKGRLPPHYGDLVTDEQKEKIYGIQAKYDADLDKLEDQLKELREKRNTEIEAVLTKEQKDKLAAAIAALKEKKSEAKEEAKTEAKPEEKPAPKKTDAKK